MNFGEVFENIIDRKLSDVHCSLPAKLVSYNASTQIASVQPLIKQKTVDGIQNELPIISNVPVFMPRASDFAIYIPLQKDDIVTLFFSDYSIDKWVQNGELADGSLKNHNLNDCYALPFTNNISGPISVSDTNSFVIKKSSVEFIVKDDKITVNTDIEVTGDVIVTSGDVTADGISLKGHTHSVNVPSTPYAGVTGSAS